jgi:hypothetical protein
VHNETEAAARTVGGAALLRQYKWSELLALRRSALGQRLFGASQRAILATALRAWREVHSRRAAAVRAFALRYALAKCELDAQLEDAPPAAATAAAGSTVQQLLAAPETAGFGTGGKGSLGQLPGRKTVLQHWKVRCCCLLVFCTVIYCHGGVVCLCCMHRSAPVQCGRSVHATCAVRSVYRSAAFVLSLLVSTALQLTVLISIGQALASSSSC